MAHLTATPFRKPSPFEFTSARGPISPPETNVDFLGSNQSLPHTREVEHLDSMSQSAAPEIVSTRPARVSTLRYQNSGPRESRDRTIQRSSKSFIIVIPPSALSEEHGQLGHTLSTGPHGRLSQGILMPLFPTMYGQLSAIAREFNFPSIAGVCLYLHITEAGITMTPRISDDTWQYMWSHVFEARSPTLHQHLPISGRVEFDIDLRQARWYNSWISSSHRDSVDTPIPSAPPSLHARGDSITTFGGDPNLDPQLDLHSVHSTQKSQVGSRHVPKKLSLVERFDAASARSASRPASRAAVLTPPEDIIDQHVLSPIVQEEEPKTASQDLELRVNSWRASASLHVVSPLAVKGQMSLEPANLSNTLTLDDETVAALEDALNLNDFQWSISSMGPNDYDPYTPASDCIRLPSPDLAHRMLEDCPPTPSTVTSWGAPLSWPSSPRSEYRPPSVDIGQRQVYSRPVTPSTATSWGPPSRPTSPLMSDSAYSIHLAHRGEHSSPATPTTATSWGAPLSYPPSPVNPFNVSTPDVGHRALEASEDDAPWHYVWPYHRDVPTHEPSTEDAPWAYVWPYQREQPSHVGLAQLTSVSVQTPSRYPHLVLYQAVYPYFDIYPAPALKTYETVGSTTHYPFFNLYPAVAKAQYLIESTTINALNIGYPHNLETIYSSASERVEHQNALSTVVIEFSHTYPAFNLYPAVYPYSLESIYAAVFLTYQESGSRELLTVNTRATYPAFSLYPAVYPYNLEEIYPTVTLGKADDSSSIGFITLKTPSTYPAFNLYASVYPYNLEEIYPAISPVILESSGYPHFNLYPPMDPTVRKDTAATVFVDRKHGPYEYRATQEPDGYPYFHLYPALSVRLMADAATWSKAVYPEFDLYPAIYPHNLGDIYKTLSTIADNKVTTTSILALPFPSFNLYPAVYPHVVPYPAVHLTTPIRDQHPNLAATSRPTPKSHSIVVLTAYPVFNLYPAVYPIFDLYPSVSTSSTYQEFKENALSSHSVHQHFDLYPAAQPSTESPGALLHATSSCNYPYFCLYRSVYPFFDLYPTLAPTVDAYTHQPSSLHATAIRVWYPVFDLYPAIYPYFNLYPSTVTIATVSRQITVELEATYPSFDLYPAVYPHFNLWPSILEPVVAPHIDSRIQNRDSLPAAEHDNTAGTVSPSRKEASKSHAQLHQSVFPDSVVVTPSGTGVASHGTDVDTHPQQTIEDISKDPETPSRRFSFAPRAGARSRSGTVNVRSQIPVGTRRPLSTVSDLPSLDTSIPPIRLTPVKGLPSKPAEGKRASRAYSRSPTSKTSPESARLSQITERPADSLLSRAKSLSKPSESEPNSEKVAALDRAQSMSSPRALHPRKRDSLVLQRVKAFDSSADMPLTMESLSHFPAPPIPPVPSASKPVSKLDLSKFQKFA